MKFYKNMLLFALLLCLNAIGFNEQYNKTTQNPSLIKAAQDRLSHSFNTGTKVAGNLIGLGGAMGFISGIRNSHYWITAPFLNEYYVSGKNFKVIQSHEEMINKLVIDRYWNVFPRTMLRSALGSAVMTPFALLSGICVMGSKLIAK